MLQTCWIPWISCPYPLDGSPLLQLDLTKHLSLVGGWYGDVRKWPFIPMKVKRRTVMNFRKVVDRWGFGGWWTIVKHEKGILWIWNWTISQQKHEKHEMYPVRSYLFYLYVFQVGSKKIFWNRITLPSWHRSKCDPEIGSNQISLGAASIRS